MSNLEFTGAESATSYEPTVRFFSKISTCVGLNVGRNAYGNSRSDKHNWSAILLVQRPCVLTIVSSYLFVLASICSYLLAFVSICLYLLICV